MIDRQHRELFLRLQRLVAAEDRGDAPAEVSSLLLYAAQYVDFHFQAEEALMARVGYPDLPSHHETHAAFRDRMTDLMAQDMAGTDDTHRVLRALLVEWLVDHIAAVDWKWAEYLKGAGVAE